jgi:hypothetical protein
MQKVEGSNPFSRSRKGLHLQVFFVRGWCDKTSTPPRLSDSAAREQDDEDLAVSACGRPDGVGGDDRLVAT